MIRCQLDARELLSVIGVGGWRRRRTRVKSVFNDVDPAFHHFVYHFSQVVWQQVRGPGESRAVPVGQYLCRCVVVGEGTVDHGPDQPPVAVTCADQAFTCDQSVEERDDPVRAVQAVVPVEVYQ
jgi:hypothetical protein